MIVIIVLLLCSGGLARGDSPVSDIVGVIDKFNSFSSIVSTVTGTLTFFFPQDDQVPIKLDEIIETLQVLAKKIDDLEFNLLMEIQKIMQQIEGTDLKRSISDANNHKRDIEDSFVDMQNFLSRPFQNYTLERFIKKTVGESLRKYNEAYFVKMNYIETLFERVARNLNQRVIISKTGGRTGENVQLDLINLYHSILAAEIKGTIVVNFQFYLLEYYFKKGNFKNEVDLFNKKDQKRKENMSNIFRKSLPTLNNLWYWHSYSRKIDSYNSLTRVSQGYMYEYLTKQKLCKGEIYEEVAFKHKTQRMFAGGVYLRTVVKMDVCNPPKSCTRRVMGIYNYRDKSRLGQGYGSKKECESIQGKFQKIRQDSYQKYFALCDDRNDTLTERQFSLDPVSSDTANNFVITGVRLIKNHKTVYFEIQQGKLLPFGIIDKNTIVWKKNIPNLSRSFTIDHKTKVHIKDSSEETKNFALTQIKFSTRNNEIYVEMVLRSFDFTTGQLLENSKTLNTWEASPRKIHTEDLDLPNLSNGLKNQLQGNGYIQFTASSRSKDAAQSTVPYIDTGNTVTSQGSPLTGFGLHYKQQPEYGGFIGPNIRLYDYNRNINDLV